MDIHEAIELYQVQLRADGRSEHTIGQVRRHLALLANWLADEGLSRELEDLTHLEVARFLASDAARLRPDGQPKTPTSMNCLRSTIRAWGAYVHAAGLTPRNPAVLTKRARCGPSPPRALTEAEQERLLAVLDVEATTERWSAIRDRCWIRLLLGLGLRLGESLAIRVEDLNLEQGELLLRRTKGARPAIAVLPDDLVALLTGYVDGRSTGALFPSKTGGHLSPGHARRRFAAWARKAGLRSATSPHSCRHSFAVRTLEQTGSLMATKGALRHRSIGSTAVYLS